MPERPQRWLPPPHLLTCGAEGGAEGRHQQFDFDTKMTDHGVIDSVFFSITSGRPRAGMSREPQKAGEQIPQRLPLKTCVGIVLINRAGQIWIGRRHHVWLSPAERTVWQMPQGGVEDGEDLESAARRELYEETGVRSVELLAMSGCWHTYQLPDALLGVALKGRYGGQRQRWFAMRFVGPDAEIDISGVTHKRPEFDAWRWAEAWEIPALAVDFKRPIYEAVLSEFVGLVGRPLAAVQDGAPKS